ncbi:MAG: hypothetical protein WCJ41_19155, partial [Aestuariivirga sp.]|uniref:hypothetical protein n=1 Tax=Aestuariivirga sp. TaxID=2650926 RepID=UPI00301694F2
EAMMVRNSSSLDRSSDLARLIQILIRQTPGMSRQISQAVIPATSASTWAVTENQSISRLRAFKSYLLTAFGSAVFFMRI